MVFCNISQNHDHDSDHMPILSAWNLQAQEKSEDSRLQFKKTHFRKLYGSLTQSFYQFLQTPKLHNNELDYEVELLVNIIDEAMNMSMPKQRLCTCSIFGFDEKCKVAQMQARRLKKIYNQNPSMEN